MNGKSVFDNVLATLAVLFLLSYGFNGIEACFPRHNCTCPPTTTPQPTTTTTPELPRQPFIIQRLLSQPQLAPTVSAQASPVELQFVNAAPIPAAAQYSLPVHQPSAVLTQAPHVGLKFVDSAPTPTIVKYSSPPALPMSSTYHLDIARAPIVEEPQFFIPDQRREVYSENRYLELEPTTSSNVPRALTDTNPIPAPVAVNRRGTCNIYCFQSC
ncbi:uncharacterized protein LOC106644262 [Copidosoma floridanum]|uniref:uncharacterized protein LOC106644262 n=1 Tax=Copidosoma floridanum TaxID=29053 RepID=UPI0006C9A803|nr:uncharacterized protein LOC106644262 [Copidosoma floridanum]